MHLQGSGDLLSGVTPSEGHPVSQGRLCARGWAAHEAPRWGARLRYPRVREHGVLRRASWDEALTGAVLALDRLRGSGRPIGVLGSGRASNEENFLAAALARCALRTGMIDAGLGRLDDALRAGASAATNATTAASALDQLEHADLIVVIGGDIATSHPRVVTGVLRALQRRAHLVTAGWHRTELSQLAAAHVSLGARSPLDALVAVQNAFATRAGRAAVDADDPAANPTEVVAALLAAAGRVAFVLAPFDADVGLLAEVSHLVHTLAADVCGASGALPLILTLPIRANSRGAADMGASPHALPGRYSLTDPAARERLRSLWGGVPTWTAGLHAEEMLDAVEGLVVLADDPCTFHRAPSRAVAAMEALDTLIVLDCFETQATKAAQVVLPITAVGECGGTVTSLEGRVQRWNACGSAVGEARPGWRVLCDLD